MSQPGRPSRRRSTGRRRRQPRGWRRIYGLWTEWWVEIVIVLAIALAVFLLVEQMQIRQGLLSWLRRSATTLGDLGSSLA